MESLWKQPLAIGTSRSSRGVEKLLPPLQRLPCKWIDRCMNKYFCIPVNRIRIMQPGPWTALCKNSLHWDTEQLWHLDYHSLPLPDFLKLTFNCPAYNGRWTGLAEHWLPQVEIKPRPMDLLPGILWFAPKMCHLTRNKRIVEFFQEASFNDSLLPCGNDFLYHCIVLSDTLLNQNYQIRFWAIFAFR